VTEMPTQRVAPGPTLNHGGTEDTETATEDSLRVNGTPAESLRFSVAGFRVFRASVVQGAGGGSHAV